MVGENILTKYIYLARTVYATGQWAGSMAALPGSKLCVNNNLVPSCINSPGQVYIFGQNVFRNHCQTSTLRTRTEMVFEMLVFSLLNHLTWLIAQESFIILSLQESNKSQCLFCHNRYATDQIFYICQILEKNRSTMGQCISYLYNSKKLMTQFREKFFTTFCLNLDT
jgi:hypothetical protein